MAAGTEDDEEVGLLAGVTGVGVRVFDGVDAAVEYL